MNYEEAKQLLQTYLEIDFHLSLDDVEITESKGYWRIKKECSDSCHHPLHGCLGNSGRIKHTISFTPMVRNRGRITSPYEVWNTMRKHEPA